MRSYLPAGALEALASRGCGMNSQSSSMLTNTQVGAIGETAVAAQLMLLSEGRLSPFLPLADDDGIDLIVFDKVTGASLPIQVKARTSGTLLKSDTVQFDLRMKTYSDRDRAFLLAIILDTDNGSIGRSWLISMSDLSNVARTAKDKYTIVPSAKKTSNDRYTPYRCDGMRAVAARLIDYLDSQGTLHNREKE